MRPNNTVRPRFNVVQAIAKAWDFLWQDNLNRRAKGHDFRGDTYYLTATDIERQVRSWAEDEIRGRPWNMKERAFGGYGSAVRFHGDLQATIRRWLFDNRKLEHHNFGRGHISGARFRPVGQPLYEGEAKTIADKQKPRRPKPRHYSRPDRAQLLCMPPRKATYRRSKSVGHSNWSEVTCPRCLKLRGQEEARTRAGRPIAKALLDSALKAAQGGRTVKEWTDKTFLTRDHVGRTDMEEEVHSSAWRVLSYRDDEWPEALRRLREGLARFGVAEEG